MILRMSKLLKRNVTALDDITGTLLEGRVLRAAPPSLVTLAGFGSPEKFGLGVSV